MQPYKQIMARLNNASLRHLATMASHSMVELIYSGLVTLYGDIDLSQHRVRKLLVVWRHQTIT